MDLSTGMSYSWNTVLNASQLQHSMFTSTVHESSTQDTPPRHPDAHLGRERGSPAVALSPSVPES